MKRLGHIRDILFVAFAGYFSQDLLYGRGSVISQAFLLIIMGLSAFYLFKTLLFKKKLDLFYKAWTALLILNIIGFVFTATYSNPQHFGMLKGILLTLLPFYPFYYFAQRGALQTNHLIRFFFIMIPLSIGHYFSNASETLMTRSGDNENVVNNISYSFVWLIPFVFLFKKYKILAFILILLIMFFIIQGAKRGAVITGGLGVLIFFYFQMRSVNKKHRTLGYTIMCIAIIGLGYYGYHIYENNEYLISRMQQLDQGGSGRNIIYANILNGWLNSDGYLHLLFGYGFASSWNFAGNFAHDDWLELLSNFGLLGVFIYGTLFYAVSKYVKNKQWDLNKRMLLLTVVSMWLLVSLFSMGYTNVTNGYIMGIFLAFLIGNNNHLALKITSKG